MKVYILYTGGTIGCVGTPLSPMPGADFAAAFNRLVTPTIESELPGTTITIESFPHTLDSTNMQPSEWVLMAARIADNYPDYDDFLVLHGTDTMAWTASALSFMLPGLSKSVTVTGSQLPMFVQTPAAGLELLFNTDAVRNVLGAIRFFTMEVPEVCLYFADRLFRGNRTVKSNSAEFVAFSSPNYHILGKYGVLPTLYNSYVKYVPRDNSMAHQQNLDNVRTNLQAIASNISNQSVLQLQTFPGYYSDDGGSQSLFASMLKQLESVSPRLAGIIFESYGIGNIPSFSSVQDQVGAMHAAGTILVDCTQVFAGGVNYNEYASGAWLKEKGVIGGQDMTSIAAMAKLTVLLAANPDATQAEIEKMMGMDAAGEMTPYYMLSGYQGSYLAPEESLFSVNGNFELSNEADGYVMLYDVTDMENPAELWRCGVGNAGRLKMQADNNLVLYGDAGNASWSSGTAQLDMLSYMKVGDDGSLKLYNINTNVAWHTIFEGSGSANGKAGKARRPKKLRKKPPCMRA